MKQEPDITEERNYISRMSLINFPCVNTQQIFWDLNECIKTSSVKVAKRVQRLSILCKLMGIDFEAWIRGIKIMEEITPKIMDIDVDKFLDKPSNIEPGTYEIQDVDISTNHIKQVIESELTRKLNATLETYSLTCKVTLHIIKRISKHDLFGSLYNAKDILFIHKGSIASRIALLHQYPDKKDLIDSGFSLGGDNDCMVLVNPKLKDYEIIRTLLVDYIFHIMLEKVSMLNTPLIEEMSHKIKDINIFGRSFEVEAHKGPESIIQTTNNVRILNIGVSKENIMPSRNDCVKFKDEIGNECHFSLLRYKRAFKVKNRIFGAELLDIVVPYKDDVKSNTHYYNYASGNWMSEIPSP